MEHNDLIPEVHREPERPDRHDEALERERRRRRFRSVITIAVPVLLALALGGVCIYAAERTAYAAEQTAYAESLKQKVQSQERDAYYELHNNVNDMQAALLKLNVTASSARHVLLLSDIWRLSAAAVANMATVPVSHVDTSSLNTFLVQAGDYANTLIQRILAGSVLNGEDYEQLDALYEASVRVGNEIKDRLDRGEFPSSLDAPDDSYYMQASAGQDATGGGEQSGQSPPAEDGQSGEGSTNKENITDYPTLIYDGPFSESNQKAQPRGLPEGEVDENAAMQKALEWLGGGELSPTGYEDGTVPAFGFTGTDAEGRAVDVTVTKQGGAVLWMMGQTEGGSDGVPEEDVTKRLSEAAQAFLEQRGYDGMEPTYAQFYNGVAVFNFAATQDEVILYADLIKVYVEQSSGAIIGVDATNYLMSHTQREFATPAIDEEQASYAVCDGLEVQSTRLALIPKTPSTEVLCYEFKGDCRGQHFIVYINAQTGAEEEIYQVIDSDQGQLVV